MGVPIRQSEFIGFMTPLPRRDRIATMPKPGMGSAWSDLKSACRANRL